MPGDALSYNHGGVDDDDADDDDADDDDDGDALGDNHGREEQNSPCDKLTFLMGVYLQAVLITERTM